jgi:hypothetical protein
LIHLGYPIRARSATTDFYADGNRCRDLSKEREVVLQRAPAISHGALNAQRKMEEGE